MGKYILVYFLLAAQALSAGDFRNAEWGMSIEEVKAGEDAKLLLEKKFPAKR